MNNKINNLVKEFLENTDAKNEDELNEKLQEFMEKYNNEEIEYENTPLDDAYDLLEEAENAKTKKQAIKLAQKAYEICPECFDAIIFQADLEDNLSKRMEILDKGLELEKSRLTKEKYFDKDNIGQFYVIFETRPYIRGLLNKATYYLEEGKLKLARDVCMEILRLNENDNTGARYLLMAIYAALEEENDMLKLYKKYPEEDLEMLFPIFALYYKMGDAKKANEYLDRVNKVNPNLLKLFKGNIKEEENVPSGYYSRGGSSEIFMYVERYFFLLITMPHLREYVLENSKIDKKQTTSKKKNKK